MKLPFLVKVEQENLASSSDFKNKISGSLLKGNGNELLRQIRSRAVIEES